LTEADKLTRDFLQRPRAQGDRCQGVVDEKRAKCTGLKPFPGLNVYACGMRWAKLPDADYSGRAHRKRPAWNSARDNDRHVGEAHRKAYEAERHGCFIP
jgi:hypothetical protein